MKINEIMTTDVEVVPPDSSIRDAAQRMARLDVGALPVCDGERLIGMLTDRDIAVRAVANGCDPDSTTVRDCMSPKIIYCFEDQTLEDARQVMEEKQIRRLPVISRDKQLVGILAIGDLAIKTDEEQEVGHTLQEISQPAA
jgi:CBS domain-containing protein